MSLTFSTPGGREGWRGNSRTRVSIQVGWAERRGLRKGRFLGVTTSVRVRLRLVRSN